MNLEEMKAAPGNTVIYSALGCAVARKGIAGGSEGRWWLDCACASSSTTAEDLAAVAGDWVLMIPAYDPKGSTDGR